MVGSASFFEGRVVPIPCPAFADARGRLSPIDLAGFDFAAVRAFVVTAGSGAVRGAHGHIRTRQILFCAAGEVEVELVFAGRAERLRLNADFPAVLVEPPVWSRQIYHGENAVLVVLCDTPYQREDYFEEIERAS
jgi:dTDP-4-dehydrorhamnose 3,5-epimerase-like enzyme